MPKRFRASTNPILKIAAIFLILIAAYKLMFNADTRLSAPYPNSAEVTEIAFDWSTHIRKAQGSDNWPITWADDDTQFTSWGDGGGFGGTNSEGRVSLGFARIDGPVESFKATNVWGGKAATNVPTFGGKSYGIISIDGVLFAWVSPGSGADGFRESRLHCSVDDGASWKPANWAFSMAKGIINPTFLQFGKDYIGARDLFVYGYAPYLKDATSLMVQKPGQIGLFRVLKTQVMDLTAYEFFAGFDVDSNPVWTDDMSSREAVFEDANGVGWNVSASYNAPIARYFLITEHSESSKGNIGIFDSKEPWGPWTTVSYDAVFGHNAIERTTFFWNFSNKWMGEDGTRVVLVFSGVESNDSWNSVEGTINLGSGESATFEPNDIDQNFRGIDKTSGSQTDVHSKPIC